MSSSEAGDSIPADLRIVDADNLRLEESALTGEADSVDKQAAALTPTTVPLADQINMAFAQPPFSNGERLGRIVATAAEQTEIGQISKAVTHTQSRPTPLTREITVRGRCLRDY